MIILIYYIFLSMFLYSNDNCYDNLEYINIYEGLEPVYEDIDRKDTYGEGTIYRKYIVEDENKLNIIISQIQKIEGWKKGIIDEDFYSLLNYGAVDKSVIGRECYYYFSDRYSYDGYYNNNYDYKQSLKRKGDRFIENYTAELFDVENRTIYFYMHDI